MKYISPHLSKISTSLRLRRISVALLHLFVYLCLIRQAAVICIPQWSHLGIHSGPSCIIITFNFKCQYMKCSMRLSGFFALSGHPSIGYVTAFITCVNNTLYLSGPSPSTSTPLVCGRTIPCVLSMWWRREDPVISLPSLLANYSGFIHILRRGPLSCLSTLVLGCPLLAPNETLGAHHWFDINNICYQSHPLEHPYHRRQCPLDPDGVAPFYVAVLHIEDDGVFTRRLDKPLFIFL